MNILITRHDKIGDFCTALPMFKVLKEQTNNKLFALVSPINEELAKEMPFIDEVLVFEKDVWKLAKKIRDAKIDLSISAYIDTTLAMALFLSGVKKRIAPATKIAQIFFNKRVKQRRSEVKMAEFEYNLELLKAFDEKLDLSFSRPLVDFGLKRENIVAFHPGFGGSSDGNLSLDEYLELAESIKNKTEVIFTFGPDDKEAKEYISKSSDFKIRDDFKSLVDFTKFLSTVRLFVSTSTGPMHLAGLSNTPTFSFFGDTLFASPKRWKTISDEKLQNNFMVPSTDFETIKKRLHENIY